MMTEKEAFIGWGTLNGFGREKSAAFCEAQRLHDEAKKENPLAHVTKNGTSYRCFHTVSCSCGFNYSYDSSD